MVASVAALRLLSAEVLVNSKHVNVPNMQRAGMRSGAQLEYVGRNLCAES
jgi:hypothetical protein